jgi:hypothetical protein
MKNKISNFVDGLYSKNGRLINDRPDSMTGIEKAAKLRKMVKKQANIEQIAEGIQRAKMLERFMD